MAVGVAAGTEDEKCGNSQRQKQEESHDEAGEDGEYHSTGEGR